MIGKLTYSYLIWQVVIHYKNFHVLLNLSFIEMESFIENIRVYYFIHESAYHIICVNIRQISEKNNISKFSFPFQCIYLTRFS